MKKLIALAVLVSVVFSSCKTTECSYVHKNYIGYK